jgi:cell division protein FtsZ
MQIADDGIKKLRDNVDTLIVIPNENLFKMVDSKTPSLQAYALADDVLRQGVQGISDLITKTGIINIDFADVQSTMKGQGDALMGIGMGGGDGRAKDAADSAIDNPLLEDTSIEGATRLLINIAGPADVSMLEVRDIMATIKAKADPNVEIIYGQLVDTDLGDNVKVTVIATGFQSKAAVSANRVDTQRKAEPAPIDFINYKQFEEMRGQGSGNRTHDGYYGIVKPRDYRDDLNIPTAIRKYNPDTDLEGKAAANGRDA